MEQTETPQTGTPPIWAKRLSNWALLAMLVAVVIAALGLTLAREDVVGKMFGFSAFLGGGLIAVVAIVLALAGLAVGLKTGNVAKRSALVALAVSVIYIGFIATRPMSAGDAPPIHDVTTDLANPPEFQVLELREDNLVGVDTVENWRQIHAAAYGDIGPVTIPMAVPSATAEVVRLAEAEGWEIVIADPVRGHVEATAAVSYIRFYDDVVIRVTPVGAGSSRIDMRSVSRVGVGDLGVNARRIRQFLDKLAG